MKHLYYLLMLLFAFGCTTGNNNKKPLGQDTADFITDRVVFDSTSVYAFEGIMMKLSVIPQTSNLRITISNNSQQYHYIALPDPFYLEYRGREGNWVKIPYKMAFIEIFTAINPNDEYQTLVDLTQFENDLQPGLYRLHQNIDFYSVLNMVVSKHEMVVYFSIE